MKMAISNGVDLMVFGSLHELQKIHKSCPKAKLLVSLKQSSDFSELLVAAKDLGLQVVGVALEDENEGQFGSNIKMMASTRMAFAVGNSIGHEMSIGELT